MTVIGRANKVLRACAGRPDGVAFNELRRACGGLAATTLSRLLRTLTNEGWVRKDPDSGRYAVGATFAALAREVAGTIPRGEVLQGVLNALADDTRESAVYFDLDGDGMVCLAKCECRDSFHYMDLMGRWGPLGGSTYGLVCLAHMTKRKRAPSLRAAVKKRGADAGELEVNLETTRRDGVLARRENVRGEVIRIASPVFAGQGGDVAGSLGVTLRVRRMKKGELAGLKQRVARAAETATELLG
jgi:DNA-binding IclR family transcriptional regulator